MQDESDVNELSETESESVATYTRESRSSEINRSVSQRVLRLEETVSFLQERVQQLEQQTISKYERQQDLTQEDLQTLSTKKMLQKIDTFEQG